MTRRAARRAAVVSAMVAALGGAAAGAEPCAAVEPGEDLQARIDAAPAVAALCLRPGRHPGPVRIGRRLTLRGPPEAVIASRGTGSTASLEAEGAALLGVTVDGSGGRFDLLDAAVRVHADGARVEGVTVRNALFGVLVERSRDVVVRANTIAGDPDQALGMRGDGIRLWEVRGSLIASNRVTDSRDVVVWYAPGNRIVGNRVERGRYGTHFMYSHDNEIADNVYVENVVGIFAMYSRDLAIRDNVIARSGGAAGVGLGAKESSGLEVVGNWFVANTVGAYLDTSPLDPALRNRFEDNVFRFAEAGVVFHGVAAGNRFEANSFRDNRAAVRVEGRGDARDATWRGNHYGDYAGYDLDGDGVGDLPYELRSLSSTLESRRPALAFFRGTVAMGLVDLAGLALPLFRPTTLLVDPRPRMHPPPRVAPSISSEG